MAHRPKRTFRQRRADSSDSDGSQEPLAEPGEPRPAEEEPPEGRGAAVAEGPLGRRGRRGRRGGVWASSRRAATPARDDLASGATESRTVDLSADEEDVTCHSSESKAERSSSSESSSSQEETEFSSIVTIPDATFIRAARRKRELARTQDYISLDTKYSSTISGIKQTNDEDPESEPDDHEKRIPFTSRAQTLRQRLAEETRTRNEEASEESQEDENQDTWEQQQMRKAVKITEGRNINLSHSSECQIVKKFDTSISFPPVSLEIIKKQLNRRLTLLQETHHSHLREYEKYIEDVKNSKSAIQKLENSSSETQSFKFYKTMKIYVDNLISFLDEKIINMQEIESSMHALLLKQSMAIMKRRQDELKHESSYLQQLCKAETSTNGSVTTDEKTQWILEEIESRRVQRREARALSGNCSHQEGTSSDEELSLPDMNDFKKSQGDILQAHKKIFEDVHDDFCKIQNVLLKFQQWREKFPDSYYEAFISLCIPKLLSPLIRVQLIDWNPLQFDSIGLKQMSWFTPVEEFMANSMKNSKNEDNSDKKILSAIINKTVIPRLTDFTEFIWDPLSTSQTSSLIMHCRVVLEHSTSENEVNKSKQDLLKSIISRMKKAIEDDVFIPLYPKSFVENKTSPHSRFQERQFWSGVKLFQNILLWNGLLPDETLQELGLGKLLNRYLIIVLLNATPGPAVVKKCNQGRSQRNNSYSSENKSFKSSRILH
ncbi:intron Large complex component GCFC2 isoform X3 [Erinaceus europaeus]|uniref:Intron Large complex component GCFC2 isoform X3 n=1 Tax=Erinaceus europaeus TaxID=9365 RepID=A0ABM3X419_ERIEU|nr:intron Large complex component GCFC2 isoform X3 [Erinaceus europaeus]